MTKTYVTVGAFVLATLLLTGGCGGPSDAGKPAGTIKEIAAPAPAPPDLSGGAHDRDTGEEAQLYRTPGGKYTAADIKANGDVPPAEKYKGVGHASGKAKAGDRVCPVSGGKPNAKVTWVVGGKTYEFCCPPCIEDFVKTAKEKPESIKDPSEYTKQ